VQTPPADAYWAFWQAEPGQNSWTYSQQGAMTYHPRPGSVALWVFGGTNLAGTAGSALPPISPASLRTPPAARAASTGSPTVVNAPPVAVTLSASHGTATPTIVAVALAVVLAAAGITAAAGRRRRGRS
jgi:hypothetical protein